MNAIYRALNGTLERREDGWYWRDGTKEPRVRDMLLNRLAPNFRCKTRGHLAYVEVPRDWQAAKYWPDGIQAPAALQAIRKLLRSSAKEGRLIPKSQWDAAMCKHCGCWWDAKDQDDIFARARALGWPG